MRAAACADGSDEWAHCGGEYDEGGDGGAAVLARVFSFNNQLLETREGKVEVAANAMATPVQLDLGPLMADGRVVLVKLELRDAAGKMLSENVYWRAASDAAYRAMNDLPKTKLDGVATSRRDGNENEVPLRLTNWARRRCWR